MFFVYKQKTAYEMRISCWSSDVCSSNLCLDNVVTSTLAREGDGVVGEYVGGYTDWLRQRPALAPPVGARLARDPASPSFVAPGVAITPKRKLGYKEDRKSVV